MFRSALLCASAAALNLVTFDGNLATSQKFVELNDPVMGGESYGSWSVDAAGEFGIFEGEVKIVPSLSAPGFIKAAADGTFADASSAIGGDLVLTVRTSTPEYEGFRVSFASGTLSPSYSCAGGGSIPFSRGCFKSRFTVPPGDQFTQVRVPFSSFSDLWSPATGDQDKTCSQDSRVCPTAAKLRGIKRVEIWAEGALGKVHLEVKSIAAEGPSQRFGFGTRLKTTTYSSTSPPAPFNHCKGPVQANLRYGVSTRDTPTVPIEVNATESLAEAVCCDTRTVETGEPMFLFVAPDINLFGLLEENGINTFYDSVCGVPLFKGPVNRTFQEFQEDFLEHGWPSFRPGEVYSENVFVDSETNELTTPCGTHLGHLLHDAYGPRYCVDLSCISGNPVKVQS